MTDDDLRERVQQLEAQVEHLQDRVDDLAEGSTHSEGTVDQYDGYVIQQLDAGETATLATLRSYYRQSGIRNDSTLKQRVKQLTRMPYFESAGTQRWRFTGRAGSGGSEENNGGGDGG